MISDLTFKELLKRGFRMDGETRVWDLADSKLWYLSDSQSEGFLELTRTARYQASVVDKEIQLLRSTMDVILDSLPSRHCNVIDLGCGDGIKASLFLSELAGDAKVRYCPIDISSYMVSAAASTVRQLNTAEVVELKWNVSDFDNLTNITPLFRENGYSSHLMLLLGNTLGNFPAQDILPSIQQSMDDSDVLVVGNGLENKGADWTAGYKGPVIDNWLRKVIKKIGLTDEDVKYDVRYRNQKVEMVYVLQNNTSVRHLDREVSFKKGDVIVVAESYKYSLEEFEKLFTDLFEHVQIQTNSDDTYAVAICKK